MKLYKHKNYKQYVKAQVDKNIKKLKSVWVTDDEIKLICQRIKNIPDIKFGICHGVRNAWEVQKFREILGIEVIGTDISPTILDFPNSIQWDFHEVKDEWIDNVDFIYTNSFDHSYDPSFCLVNWMKCIKKNGLCFIQWMASNQNKLDPADCFAGTKKDYRKLFNKYFNVIEEIGDLRRTIFVIEHKRSL
jgi:hypothetical protein